MRERRPLRRRILPFNNMAGPSLVAVAMVMSFLACLVLGTAVLVDKAATRWLVRATSAMTIQVVETERLTAEEQLPYVMDVLSTTAGVRTATPLERARLVALLEPWLGAGNVSDNLPLPILVEIILDPSVHFDSDGVAAHITSVAPGARLDTHGRWRETLDRASFILRFFASVVVTIVVIAFTLIIFFATRAGLLANDEVLLVLDQVGATDGFIARRFVWHFTRLIAFSTLVSAGWAILTFYLLGTYLPDARASALLGAILLVPAGAIILSVLITRAYVLRTLAKISF